MIPNFITLLQNGHSRPFSPGGWARYSDDAAPSGVWKTGCCPDTSRAKASERQGGARQRDLNQESRISLDFIRNYSSIACLLTPRVLQEQTRASRWRRGALRLQCGGPLTWSWGPDPGDYHLHRPRKVFCEQFNSGNFHILFKVGTH